MNIWIYIAKRGMSVKWEERERRTEIPTFNGEKKDKLKKTETEQSEIEAKSEERFEQKVKTGQDSIWSHDPTRMKDGAAGIN